MADLFSEVIAPIPVYQEDHKTLRSLMQELQKEKDKKYILARDLALEKFRGQQLECFIKSLELSDNNENTDGQTANSEQRTNSKSKKIGSNSDLFSVKTQIGSYSTNARKEKIHKYKEKIRKHKQSFQFFRKFNGRSTVAKIKPRVNGRFVKSTENNINELIN